MLEPVAVKLLGPVQLYVVVPEAVVLAVRVVDVLVQVNTPELLADALTAIPDTPGETGFARRTSLYNNNNRREGIIAILYLFKSNEMFICSGLI